MAEQNNNKTRSLQDIKNYTFTKGMNDDASPEAQPADTYRAALNMVKESSEGDENFLTTEYSNAFRIKLPGKVLHSNLIKQLNQVVVFLHTNEIGLYDPNLNTYTKLYASPGLNFSIYIDSVSFTKTECEDVVLIFWDSVNRVRNINISKFIKEGPGDGPVEELELFKTADTCINLSDVSFIENAAYNVDAGVYRPFIQYEDEDGNTTNYYIINENIPLIEDGTNGTYEYIDGNESKILNKSIVLKFDNVDTKYPFINVGFIKTVNGVPTAFIFKRKQPTNIFSTVTYEGDTTFIQTVDIAEVLTKRAFYLSAKTGLIYNNSLLLGGLKGKRNVDYQQYANKISVKYVTGRINLSRTKGYKNPEHIIHHKSWMRDENYMLGIVLEFEDMSESAAFPLINKQYTPFPEFTGSGGPRPETNDTKLCCTDDRVYWKEVNTAKRTAYNHFAGDLSVTDFCSGTIDNNSNNIRSEGYLGYFESEEKYPVILRCGASPGSLDVNDYMYPVDTSTGKAIGKNITLFKMPDSTIEPFHNNIIDDFAIEDNKNRFDSKYDNLEIYPLGLKLENIEFPTLEETDGVKVTGYRIVYVRRDTFNKSVQDKGWFVEMFKNNLNGTDYIYPKHNVNSGAKWDYFSNLRDRTIESSSPIQDFVRNCGYGKHYDNGIIFYGGNTLFSQLGVNVNHVKIEQQYNTTGYYIDSVRGQNSDRFSTIGDNTYDPSTFLDKDGRFRSASIQIYNLYNYGYDQKSDGTLDRSRGYFNRTEVIYQFKNICTDNYSYVNDNVILNKILNSDFSLVNFYRESGFYLDFNNPTDLSFNKNYREFNNQTFTVASTTTVTIPLNTFLSPGQIVTISNLGGCNTTSVFGPVGRQFTVINGTTLQVIGTPFTLAQVGLSCNTIDYDVSTSRQYFNSDSSAKKCNCTTLFDNIVENIIGGIGVRLLTATSTSDILVPIPPATSFPTTITDYPNGTIFTINAVSPPTVPFLAGDKYKWNSTLNQLEKQSPYYSPIPSPLPIDTTLDFEADTWVNQTFTVPAGLGKIINYANSLPTGSQITIINSPGSPLANGQSFIVSSTTQITYTGFFNLDGGSSGVTLSNVSIRVNLMPGNSDQYFLENYLDNATSTNILNDCNTGYIYYGSIKNNLPRQYGSIDDMFFIDTGLKGCAGQNSLIGFYGDSYINTFSFVRTGVTGMLEDSIIDDNSATFADKFDPKYTINNIIGASNRSYLLNLYLAQKANITLLNTVTESDVNLDLRYEGPTFNEVYYPKLANGKYKLFSTRKIEYAEDCYLNTYFYELFCNNKNDNCTTSATEFIEYNDAYRNFHDNKINLNNDYNELNGMRFNLIKPINSTYKTCECDTEFDNRIAISSKDNQSISQLNYSKFLPNDFITLPHKEGKITNLFKENQVLYAHTTDNVWKLLTLESRLQADNNQVYLGTNNLLSSQSLELFASNEGYMGLQDKRFSFQNNTGYFFADLKTQTLNLMSGGRLDAISTYGMNSFFKNQWNTYFNSYGASTNSNLPIIPQSNPDLSTVEIYFGYDYRHKRLLLTDKTNGFTLSYYPEDKAFYSFHSYLPMAYLQNRDTFFTQNDNYDVYIHQDNFNSYRKFYGVNYPSLIDGVFTYHPLVYTTLNNVGMKIDAYKNVNGQLLITNEVPTSLQVWTSRQHSGEVFLKTPINADYMENVVLNNQFHNIINGVVYCNNLANYVLDDTINFLNGDIFPVPNANVSFSKDWTQVDRLENNFFNYRISIDNKDLENLKFILKFTVLNYNISMR
jgi:hypothetical protein